MNKNIERVLEEIINYVKDNQSMPSMRYLQNKLNYKSVNSVFRYIKLLEENNYLKRNHEGKIIINKYSEYYYNGLKTITIINRKNKYISLLLNKNDYYLAYQINHNYFNNIGIFNNDILIIKKNRKLNNNDLGLFIIDNKYRILKYTYKDGFYILSDNEELLLNKVKILGKVIMVEKKL